MTPIQKRATTYRWYAAEADCAESGRALRDCGNSLPAIDEWRPLSQSRIARVLGSLDISRRFRDASLRDKIDRLTALLRSEVPDARVCVAAPDSGRQQAS